jgi:signal transduction histidine kinase
MMLKIGLVISALIIIIEGVLLFYSLDSRRAELINLRDVLELDVQQKAGKSFHDLHPEILNDEDIDRRMKIFSTNVLLMTILITFLVVTGTLSVFYFGFARHVINTTKLNRKYMNGEVDEIPIYKKELLPENELGELLESRNALLIELQEYQNQLEEKVEAAKEQLLHTAKLSAVGEITSSIIHDIKTPLTVISLNSEMMSNKIALGKYDQEKIVELNQKVHKSADRINKLVQRMGDFVRKGVDYNQRVNLKEVIRDSIDFAQAKITQNKVVVSSFLTDSFVVGDSVSLEQVFTNLLSNSCDAMDPSRDGHITIEMKEEAENIIIIVEDNGIGMNNEIQEKVFESFFTTKEKGKGTGLGLANVVNIVEKSGGEISLQSEVGVGTKFSLILKRYK